MIIVKLLLAIICYNFKHSLDKYHTFYKKLNYAKLTPDDILKKHPRDPIYEIFKRFRSIVNFNNKQKDNDVGGLLSVKKNLPKPQFIITNKKFFFGRKNSMTLSHQELHKHLLENNVDKERVNSKDLNLFNEDFSENLMYSMRNPYFDSQNLSIQLKYFNEFKYNTIFIKAIIYVMFLSSLIIIFLLNNQSPWNNIVTSAIQTTLLEPFDVYDSTSQIKRTYSFNNISKIN